MVPQHDDLDDYLNHQRRTMSAYVKAIIAILGGIGTWGITAAADNSITGVELFGLLSALSTALGVYAFPNAPLPPEE